MNNLNITLLLFTLFKCFLLLLHHLDDSVLHFFEHKFWGLFITDEDRMHTNMVVFVK